MTGWTEPPDPAVLADWRSGPRWWHVVVALVADPAVLARRAAAVAALGDAAGPTAPQAHVTVWVAGRNPPVGVPDGERLAVGIGGAATFAAAAYLRAAAPAAQDLRAHLARLNPPEDRTAEYVPHITVATYRRRLPLTVARQRLAALAGLPDIPVTAPVRHLVVDCRDPMGGLRRPPRAEDAGFEPARA